MSDYVYDYEKERREAIDAGRRALNSLRAAKKELDSARSWGMWDMFGGNLISGMMKHSKMNNAQNYINQAKYDLKSFEKELSDVANNYNLNVNVSDFMSFADFFFDGLFVDFMVQSKINDARRQVDEAIRRVQEIVNRL